MDKIVNFLHNITVVARLDSDNIVHNHTCPIGMVGDNNIIYDNDNNNNAIGRIDGSNSLLASAGYLLLFNIIDKKSYKALFYCYTFKYYILLLLSKLYLSIII